MHGPAGRPNPQPLGKIPSVDFVWRDSVWSGLRARLHHAGSQPERQNDLRRRHLHAADAAIYRGQHSLLRARRRHY